jgi:threonine dehydrogenase-like Zn-dependent dehydrogenase
LDWSLVWNRRITVAGTDNFGPEPTLDGRHTMHQVVEWLGDETYPVDGLVTHTYELDDWRDGLATASSASRAHAVMTTLRPNADVPLVE